MSNCKGCPEGDNSKYPQRWGDCHEMSEMVNLIPPDYERVKILPDGGIQYKKGPDDFESPRPIDGYTSIDGWTFKCLWKPCQARMYSVEVKPACECIEVRAACLLLSPPQDNSVKYEDCKDCRFLREYLVAKVGRKTINSLQYPENLDIHNSKLETPGKA